jgi:hypothetical protein
LALGFAQRARSTSRLAREGDQPPTLSTGQFDKVPPGHQDDLGGQKYTGHRKAMREALEPRAFDYEAEHDAIVAGGGILGLPGYSGVVNRSALPSPSADTASSRHAGRAAGKAGKDTV